MRTILLGSATAALALGVSIAAVAQSPPAPSAVKGVAPALSVNHFQVTVSDLKRSQEFYSKLLGATVIDTSPNTWTSSLPGTNGMWLSLTKAEGTDPLTGLTSKPGTFDFGIGIDLTPKNAESLRRALKQALQTATIVSPGKPGDAVYDRVIYVDNPADAVRVRLVSSKDDGRLPNADKTPAVPHTPMKGVVQMRNMNHLNVRAHDVNRSVELYSTLLAAPVRERAANGRGATLSVAGGPFWLRMTTAKDPSVPLMDHTGIGIELTPDKAESIRNALKEAFPTLKVYSPGAPPAPGAPPPAKPPIYTRSVYIIDPDGLVHQLISHTDIGD